MTKAATNKSETKSYRNFKGKSFAFFGDFSYWPTYHIRNTPSDLVATLGATIKESVDKDLDYLVIGSKAFKGRAKSQRDAEKFNKKGAKIKVLDEAGFLHLVHPKIKGASFAFIGGFNQSRAGMEQGPGGILKPFDVSVLDKVETNLDFLVLGDKRGKGKTAFLRKTQELNEQGAGIRIISETEFFDMIGRQHDPNKKNMDIQGLVVKLRTVLDPRRIDRAVNMLKNESYQLFVDLKDDSAGGIVRSQSNPDSFYANWISGDGRYACYNEELHQCMGLQGFVCKHIIVLLIGMLQNEKLDSQKVYQWSKACYRKKPSENREAREIATDLLIHYKGAQMGELEWRPIETIPEDYYAF